MSKAFFPDFSRGFSKLLPDLAGKRVAVIGHIRPDGDCIGSQVALCRILRSRGIDATTYNEHPCPRNLLTFLGDTPFVEAAQSLPDDIDYRIAVDCSGANRMGSKLSQYPIQLCIDHHLSNNGFAEINWIDARAAATAEIIAGIVSDCQIDIDPVTAQALYVGIATDTGQFRYTATSERVFQLCSSLVKAGANPNEAAHQLYEREPSSRMKLLQRFLPSIESHLGGQLAFGKITQSMLKETKARREETEGFIDYARNIDTVKIAALLEEQPDGSVKGSLRSKFPEYQVDELAARFNGGGHACAAGFHSDTAYAAFPDIFIKEVEKHLDQLKR